LAFGFDVTGPYGDNEQFLSDAVDLVNLALLGLINSNTIVAFLKYYKLVDLDASLPDERSFGTTIRIATSNDYSQRHARIRAKATLDKLRRNATGGQSIPTAS
jgi:hypothetical protein